MFLDKLRECLLSVPGEHLCLLIDSCHYSFNERLNIRPRAVDVLTFRGAADRKATGRDLATQTYWPGDLYGKHTGAENTDDGLD